MSDAIKAYEGKSSPIRETIYEYADGRKEKYVGGSKAWRNNNPGNLRPAGAHLDQIGVAWGMAVFPTWQKGKIAMRAQLRRPIYNHLSIGAAIYKYAPPNENSTEDYIRYVVKKTGFSRKVILSTLDDIQLLLVVDAMISFEHTLVGKIIVVDEIKPKKNWEIYLAYEA